MTQKLVVFFVISIKFWLKLSFHPIIMPSFLSCRDEFIVWLSIFRGGMFFVLV